MLPTWTYVIELVKERHFEGVVADEEGADVDVARVREIVVQLSLHWLTSGRHYRYKLGERKKRDM